MATSNSVYVEGSEIIKNGGATANIYMNQSEYVLVTGKVYSPNKEALKNIAIKINMIDKSTFPPKKEFLGVTFTDEDGVYGISLLWAKNYEYQLIPYS
jgi:hypothetical protein